MNEAGSSCYGHPCSIVAVGLCSLQPSLASAWSVPNTPPPEQMTHQTVRGQGVGTRARQPGICPHKTGIPTPGVGEGGMWTGTEAALCPADVYRQHPGVGEPVSDVWNLWARAGAAVQRAGPGRQPPVSVSGAGRGESLGSPGALSEAEGRGRWWWAAQQPLPTPVHSPLWAAGHCSAELQAQFWTGSLAGTFS